MARDYVKEEKARREMFRILAAGAWHDPMWHEEVGRYALDTALQAADRRTLSLGTGAMPFYDMVYPPKPELADADLKGTMGGMSRQPAGYRILGPDFQPIYEFTAGDAVAMIKYGRLYPPGKPGSGQGLSEDVLPELSRAAIRKMLSQLLGPRGINVAAVGDELVFDISPFEDPECGEHLFITTVARFCLPRQVVSRLRFGSHDEIELWVAL